MTAAANANGKSRTLLNLTKDSAAKLSIDPQTADGITWAGAQDTNKDLINTKATQRKGDYVTLSSFTATSFWQVPALRGLWAKET